MLKRVDRLLITDMVVAIEEIYNFIEGYNYETFIGDTKTKAAVVRNLEIVSEAASMVSEETKLLYPLVEWKEMKSLRNKLIHDYFGIDFSIVWNIINDEIQYNYHFLKTNYFRLIWLTLPLWSDRRSAPVTVIFCPPSDLPVPTAIQIIQNPIWHLPPHPLILPASYYNYNPTH